MDDLRLLVVGEGGLVRVNMAAPDQIDYQLASDGIYSGELEHITVEHQQPFDGWFEAEMRAFASGVLGEEVDVPDIRQGHYVESVLEAVAAAANHAVQVKK